MFVSLTIISFLITCGRNVDAGYGDFSLVPTGWPLGEIVNENVINNNNSLPEVNWFTGRVRSATDNIKGRLRGYNGRESAINGLDDYNRLAEVNDIQEIKRSPVILLPGYGGSRLEAKWDKKQVEHYFCDSHSDWSDMWINVKLLLPYMIDCLIENMRLEYDYGTNTTKNTQGVEVRVKDPDTVSSVEYLNNLRISSFAYFAPIIRKLTMGLGYKREIDIRGAPYDFRKAPDELQDYFIKLKDTSEKLYSSNGDQRVTYICHSMGCNNILYFLQHQTQDWKDKYVRRIISIASPWAGALSALRAVALGDNLGMPYLFDESKLIRVQRSLPSTIYLFPHKRAFSDAPLIRSNVGPIEATLGKTRTPQANSKPKTYMAHDYEPFFDSIQHPEGYQIWLKTKDLLGSLEAPGVEVWCLVGRGKRTLGRMEYEGSFPNSPSVEYYDDGDGTVTLQSSKYCQEWAKEQNQPIFVKEFDISHMDILKDAQVLKYIERILDHETPTENKFNINQNFI